MESLVDFPLIPKYVSLNDVEWLFHVKFCLRACILELFSMAFENSCVKTNTDRGRHVA